MTTRRDLANAIRALSMDAVQKANSGHPGAPMGMADIAEVLWNDHLKHNPANPGWWDRDRFVLSNGHGSMLLYSLLHLSGYDLSTDDLKNFRQYHSKTPGHPEYGETPGVETTTGPLGQGIANAVGMALAEQLLARRFNRDGHDMVDHRTWVFMGDGCLMEGISHEVCSLAGRLGLGKLVAFWDDNQISIDGDVDGWFTDDTPGRFEAYGWQVVRDVDGHDPEAISQAIAQAVADDARPTLICCRTVIGFGSPNKQGTAATHGAPLGDDEIALVREELGWPHAPFEVPADIREAWNAAEKGQQAESEWDAKLQAYQAEHPELAAEFIRRMEGKLPSDWAGLSQAAIAQMQENGGDVATRKSSEIALEAFGPSLPELIGGSADLTGSNNTFWSGSVDINEGGAEGNYIYYGVREFGMTAISTGMALHGGLLPYDATFLVFSDYARNALRMSSLIGVQSIHVYTHDSIGLGEDGPTHQPVEHVASLRLIPGLHVWRPCDTVETGVAWQQAIENRSGSTALVLTRQKLRHQSRNDEQLANISRGGYVLREANAELRVVLMATGSEVEIAMDTADLLEADGIGARVVSMPNPELFLTQDASYRDAVLPPDVSARLAIEAGVPMYWLSFVGPAGRVIGVDRFGASAPGNVMFEKYGLTAEHARQVVLEII